MVIILKISENLATLVFLEMKGFWNNYNVITSVHDFTNRVFLRDSNYIVDMVMWEKVW